MVPALWVSGENAGRPLTAEEQALLAVISTVVRFRRRERIYAEGDGADAVFNIISGVVKSYRKLPDGRQHIVSFLFADDLIGNICCGDDCIRRMHRRPSVRSACR